MKNIRKPWNSFRQVDRSQRVPSTVGFYWLAMLVSFQSLVTILALGSKLSAVPTCDSEEPEPIYAKVGESVEIPCPCHNTSMSVSQWLITDINGRKLYRTYDHENLSTRYTIKRLSLNITPVEPSDTGTFQCHFNFINGPITTLRVNLTEEQGTTHGPASHTTHGLTSPTEKITHGLTSPTEKITHGPTSPTGPEKELGLILCLVMAAVLVAVRIIIIIIICIRKKKGKRKGIKQVCSCDFIWPHFIFPSTRRARPITLYV